MSQKEEKGNNRSTHGAAVWRPVVMPRLYIYPVGGESTREDSVCLELRVWQVYP